MAKAPKKPQIGPIELKVGGVAAEDLRRYVERIENLEADIAGLNDDKREVFAELKNKGYDAQVVAQLIAERKRRRKLRDKRRAQLELFDLYDNAVGEVAIVAEAA